MNKIVVMLLCAAMSITAMAQPQFRNRQQNQKKPNADMVVNMQVIKHIGLDSVKVKAVKDLKREKGKQFFAMMKEMRQQQDELRKPQQQPQPEAKPVKKNDKKDKKVAEQKPEKVKPTPEQIEAKREAKRAMRKAQMEKMQKFVKDYRADLRKLLGDEKYIEYLEKLSAQKQMPQQQNWQKRGKRPQQMQHRGRKPMRQAQRQTCDQCPCK